MLFMVDNAEGTDIYRFPEEVLYCRLKNTSHRAIMLVGYVREPIEIYIHFENYSFDTIYSFISMIRNDVIAFDCGRYIFEFSHLSYIGERKNLHNGYSIVREIFRNGLDIKNAKFECYRLTIEDLYSKEEK